MTPIDNSRIRTYLFPMAAALASIRQFSRRFRPSRSSQTFSVLFRISSDVHTNHFPNLLYSLNFTRRPVRPDPTNWLSSKNQQVAFAAIRQNRCGRFVRTTSHLLVHWDDQIIITIFCEFFLVHIFNLDFSLIAFLLVWELRSWAHCTINYRLGCTFGRSCKEPTCWISNANVRCTLAWMNDQTNANGCEIVLAKKIVVEWRRMRKPHSHTHAHGTRCEQKWKSAKCK